MTHSHIAVSPDLAPPSGYAHAVISPPGGVVVHLGGQTALDPRGRIVGDTLAAQFDVAADNLVHAMRAAGCEPADLVSLQVFCTDVGAYRDALGELGAIWRARFGRRYPAMGLFGVTRLFDEEAMVELMGVCVRVPREDEVHP
jgi:enamine deaminase RidA (YjgF/YER057c/UK114 family)